VHCPTLGSPASTFREVCFARRPVRHLRDGTSGIARPAHAFHVGDATSRQSHRTHRGFTPAPHPLTQSPAEARSLLIELYDAAVAGAAPGPVTTAALHGFPARGNQRIWLYAMGKAAHPMAAAAVAALKRAMLTIVGGVIIAPELEPSPHAAVRALQGNHPLPGRLSFTAADRIGEAAVGMRSDDIALVLLSGGVSSLIAAPLRGMAEADVGQLFELLLGAGLDIHQMNGVRKRFTRWGAGRLALALAPARTFTFAISDVIGDDPADIGSGPCTPDVMTVKQVVDLLQRSSLLSRLSPAMREYLAGVTRGSIPETPKPTHPAFAHVSTRVIGSNRLAVDAVAAHAAALSIDAEVIRAPLSGDAATSGVAIADALILRAQQGRRGCTVWGGETTVELNSGAPLPTTRGSRGAGTIAAPNLPPSGGRCQELALAAAQRLAQGGDAAMGITLIAAGTDGRDGTVDAAGAFADAHLWESIRELGHDPEAALRRHESHAALATVGALLPRRYTGTNVMDVVIGLVS
jgi:glycerate 2-kinase